MFGVSGSGLRVSGFERGGMDGRVDRVEGDGKNSRVATFAEAPSFAKAPEGETVAEERVERGEGLGSLVVW